MGNGALYCMLFVDRAMHYTWIYPLKSLHHEFLKAVLSTWAVDIGQFPKYLYTNFDNKILEGPTAAYLRANKVNLRGLLYHILLYLNHKSFIFIFELVAHKKPRFGPMVGTQDWWISKINGESGPKYTELWTHTTPNIS